MQTKPIPSHSTTTATRSNSPSLTDFKPHPQPVPPLDSHSTHYATGVAEALGGGPTPESHVTTPPPASEGNPALRHHLQSLHQQNNALIAQNSQLQVVNQGLQLQIQSQGAQIQQQNQALQDLANKVTTLTNLLTAQAQAPQAQAGNPVTVAAREVESMRWELTFLQFDINRATRSGSDTTSLLDAKKLCRESMLQSAGEMVVGAQTRASDPTVDPKTIQSDLRELRFQRTMLAHELDNVRRDGAIPSAQGLDVKFQNQLTEFDTAISLLAQAHALAMRGQSGNPNPKSNLNLNLNPNPNPKVA